MQEEPGHRHPVQLKHLEKKEALDDRNEMEKLQGKMGATEDGNLDGDRTRMMHQRANNFSCLHLVITFYSKRSNRCYALDLNIISTVSVSHSPPPPPAPSSSPVSTCQTVMAGEALVRRTIWEPSVYFAKGSESFHFAGHDINIRESIDTYGALIWPAVGSDRGALSVYRCKRETERRFAL